MPGRRVKVKRCIPPGLYWMTGVCSGQMRNGCPLKFNDRRKIGCVRVYLLDVDGYTIERGDLLVVRSDLGINGSGIVVQSLFADSYESIDDRDDMGRIPGR